MNRKKLIGVIVACVAVIVVVVAVVVHTLGDNDAEVAFADPNLEAAVREAIGIPEGSIYPSDLGELTSLNATEKNIADLTGLEYCTNLTELNLSDKRHLSPGQPHQPDIPQP